MVCRMCSRGFQGEARVKDVASGPFVRAESHRQSEERQQGWSSWISTREVSAHHLVNRVLGALYEEKTIKK